MGFLLLLIVVVATCNVLHSATERGFSSEIFSTSVDFPRELLVINNELFALERRTGSVVQVNPKRVVANAPNLNHGLSYGCGYLYASSATTVYRWSFDESTLSVTGAEEQVVTGLPPAGHITRTLLVHPSCVYLYLSVGSGADVDVNSDRARVLRFQISMLPQHWEQGTCSAVFYLLFTNSEFVKERCLLMACVTRLLFVWTKRLTRYGA